MDWSTQPYIKSHLDTMDLPAFSFMYKLWKNVFSHCISVFLTWLIYIQFTLSLSHTHTHTHTQSLVTSLLLSFSPFSCFSHTQTSVSRFISLPPPSDPPSSAHKHKPSVAASHTLCLFHSQTCMLPADLSHFLSSCVHIHLTHLLPSPSVHTHTLLD